MLNFITGSRHFSRDVILVFTALAVTVIAAMIYFTVQAKHHISQNYIEDAAARAEAEFRVMTEAMRRDILLVSGWGAAGKLSLADTKSLNDLLFPMLRRDPLLYGISVVDTDGNSYYVANSKTGWRTSRTGDSDAGRRTVRKFWDADRQLISEATTQSQYDPRQRPWFHPTLSTEDVYWTEPYKFYDHEDVGITGAVACGKPEDGKQLIVAFDILLDNLFEEIQRMAPSKNSRVVIFRRDAHLYVAGTRDVSSDFLSLAQVKDPLVQKVYTSWDSSDKPLMAAFSIRHDNEYWWSGLRPLDGSGRNIWIGVMVPEADIVGGITRRRVGLWSMAGLILMLLGGLAFWMIRRYGSRFGGVEPRFDPRAPEQSIQRMLSAGEGRSIEFKSTMRMNLHTRKSGKEIEIAWLKAVTAFMNTDGGTVLLGVTDDGRLAGLAPDGFASEDKCRLHFKNLINQHIGAEFSRYLRFTIVAMDDKQVGVLSCARSPEPVFLKSARNEAFYIRNGPSSDELPVSKVVSYIQNRS